MRGCCAFGVATIIILLHTLTLAQSKSDSTIRKDSTILNEVVSAPKVPRDSIYRRALAVFDASSIQVSSEAIRAYSSPMTFSSLLEQFGAGFSLMQSDLGYGRESFNFTNRTSEPIASSFLDGVLPLNDPLTGNTTLNLFPLEIASNTSIEHGGMLTSLDHGSSDAINFSLERFRAPIPYSRFHYSYPLSGSGDLSNFEGLFSVNPSEPLNLVFSVYHRNSGSALRATDYTFNPLGTQWWVRAQSTYDTKTIHATLFTLYTSAFSGTNGGIKTSDSATDIFDPQLATVSHPFAFDHKTRFDVLGQIGLSLFSEKDPTVISAYSTLSARRMLGVDSTFPIYYQPLAEAQRYGVSLSQPAALEIGPFITRATIRGDFQSVSRQSSGFFLPNISEQRFSALGSDSLSLTTSINLSASGFFRATFSKLTVAGSSTPDLVFTNFGLQASVKLTEALKLTAQANYSRDRASLSPSPLATYEIKNLAAFLSMNIPFGRREKFSLSLGYLDRHEPEGIVVDPGANDSYFFTKFSSLDLHSGSISANMDLWFSYFRYQLYTTYFPSTSPISTYTTNPALRSDLTKRIISSTGLFWENEVSEGNLRISAGIRLRYANSTSPTLSYDPFSDSYFYRGLERSGNLPLIDSRLHNPTYLFDVLVSTTVDQRATLNISFLNILSAPYYNVAIYPRSGFQVRLDVTWAFLD
ncbi:MAG: hypothetical protein WCH46_00045 [bacterium]